MKNKDNVKQIDGNKEEEKDKKDTRRILRLEACLLYTSPSPRDCS